MTVEPLPAPRSLVGQVAALLAAAGEVDGRGLEAATRRLALMYAEAVDDADEPDALFRFGPRLQACLFALGLELPIVFAAGPRPAAVVPPLAA